MRLSIWWKIFLWAAGLTGLLVVGLVGFVAYDSYTNPGAVIDEHYPPA